MTIGFVLPALLVVCGLRIVGKRGEYPEPRKSIATRRLFAGRRVANSAASHIVASLAPTKQVQHS